MSALIAACVFSVYALRSQAQAIINQVPAVVQKVSRVVDVFDSGTGPASTTSGGPPTRCRRPPTRRPASAAGNRSVVVVQQPGFQVKDLLLNGGRNVIASSGRC